MDYVVEYYEKEDRSKPAEDFILAKDTKMRAKRYRTDYQRRKEN